MLHTHMSWPYILKLSTCLLSISDKQSLVNGYNGFERSRYVSHSANRMAGRSQATLSSLLLNLLRPISHSQRLLGASCYTEPGFSLPLGIRSGIGHYQRVSNINCITCMLIISPLKVAYPDTVSVLYIAECAIHTSRTSIQIAVRPYIAQLLVSRIVFGTWLPHLQQPSTNAATTTVTTSSSSYSLTYGEVVGVASELLQQLDVFASTVSIQSSQISI